MQESIIIGGNDMRFMAGKKKVTYAKGEEVMKILRKNLAKDKRLMERLAKL